MISLSYTIESKLLNRRSQICLQGSPLRRPNYNPDISSDFIVLECILHSCLYLFALEICFQSLSFLNSLFPLRFYANLSFHHLPLFIMACGLLFVICPSHLTVWYLGCTWPKWRLTLFVPFTFYFIYISILNDTDIMRSL